MRRIDDIAEIARAGANAYADLAAADGWFAARGHNGWAGADAPARHAALIRAAEWLDGQFRFRGSPVDPAQPRAWPRTAVGAGGAQPDGLPMPVRQAYFELALALLAGDEAGERLLGLQGAVRRERIGGLAIEYEASGGSGGRLRALLAPYLHSAAATRIART